MAIIYKPLGNEIQLSNTAGNTITTSNTVGQGCLVRIVNITGSISSLIFQYSNGAQYANMSILPANAYGEVVVWKNNTDLLMTNATNSMVASSVAFKGI